MVAGKRLSIGDRFLVWKRVRDGVHRREIAAEFGVHPSTVWRIAHDVRMEKMGFDPGVGRLSFEHREEISRGLAAGRSGREIAKAIGVDPSTVTREIRRNGGRDKYRAQAAHERAFDGARRPKRTVFEHSPRLTGQVEEWLEQQWSPEQISAKLLEMFPDDPEMRVSPETIYKALLVHPKGGLRKELRAQLRTRRKQRKSQVQGRRSRASAASRIPEANLIVNRPAEVEQRSGPGDWEGDLIMGHNNGSQLATMVDRSTGVVLLAKPNSREASETTRVLAEVINRNEFPFNTLTWDRGVELADHKNLAKLTEVKIYFADPYAPWQRGSNENVNGLLRQYFVKGRDLSDVTQEELDFVMDRLNNRPRKRYDFLSPLEQHEKLCGALAP